MKKLFILTTAIILAVICKAQVIGDVNVLDRDVANIQYTPIITTDEYSYQRFSSKLGGPPISFKKNTIFVAGGFDLHSFNYSDKTLLPNTSPFEKIFNINVSVLANHKFNDKWSFNILALPHLLSNSQNGVNSSDLNINGMVFLEYTYIRKKSGYFKFGFGPGYQTLYGNTKISPIVFVKGRFNEHISLVAGMPNTYVKFDFNDKHSLKGLVDINDFSTNLNNYFLADSVNTPALEVKKAVFTVVSIGMEYNYWIKPPIGFMIRISHDIWSEYELRNNDNENVHALNSSFNRPFISIGLKFNPIRHIQNSLNPNDAGKKLPVKE